MFKNKQVSKLQCKFCELSKHQRAQFLPQPYEKPTPFVLVHSDIWGPSRVNNIIQTQWLIIFIDDHTHLYWVYLIKEKTKVKRVSKNFHEIIQNQFETKIKMLQTDNGKEHYSSILGTYLSKNGIIYHSSCIKTP